MPSAARREACEVAIDAGRRLASGQLVWGGAEHDDRRVRICRRERIPRRAHRGVVAFRAHAPIVDRSLHDHEIGAERRVEHCDAFAEGRAIDAGFEISAPANAVDDRLGAERIRQHVGISQRVIGCGRAVGPRVTEHQNAGTFRQCQRCEGEGSGRCRHGDRLRGDRPGAPHTDDPDAEQRENAESEPDGPRAAKARARSHG